MKDKSPPHTELKDLHQNSDYPVHHDHVGTVKHSKQSKECCGCVKSWFKKLFGKSN